MNIDLKRYFDKSHAFTQIDNRLFKAYNVKKGLRNEDGTGVCIGLTKIADVIGYKKENGLKIDTKGRLIYRGIEIEELIHHKPLRYGFESTFFLLLFGYLPNVKERDNFKTYISENYHIKNEFILKNIRAIPTTNIMNKLQQMVLMLYNYDVDGDDISPLRTLEKGISIIAKLPFLICYGYHSKYHIHDKSFLSERKDLSLAENFLYFLRDDHKYTTKEANILDIMLILHADHGGGNNSTFTNVVISSAGSDIYSTMAASIASMKGVRHGGANIQVAHMMKEIITKIGYQANDDEIEKVLIRQLKKEFYDESGLIYGIGHAIYTLSDPRSEILKTYAKELAIEKDKLEEFLFYERVEDCAKRMILKEKGIHVCSNIDFYSGFVYQLLKIPEELYTPLFVSSRMAGWLAHNLENKLYDGKIMRPATRYVGEHDKEDLK